MEYKGILIYPPPQLLDREIPKPDGSLGLLYIAAALEKNNIPTDILDAAIGDGSDLKNTLFRFVPQDNDFIKIGMSFEEIANYVHNGKYTFVGITSNFTPQTRMAIETARAIKNINPQIKIYIGGINARSLKEKFLNCGYFDGVCLTDGELIFPRVILEGIENVPGWAYLKDGNIKINPIDKTCFPKHLDDLPMPAWEKVLSPQIEGVTGRTYLQQNELSAVMITSRGCPYHCIYCFNSGDGHSRPKLRYHSLSRVILEIKRLKELGITKIYFDDDSLLTPLSRAKKIFELIKDENITFLDANGVNLISLFNKDKEINGKWEINLKVIKMLQEAGFKHLGFPVESGSQRIIDKYGSGKVRLDKMDVIKLLKILNEFGIKTPVNFVIGFPDETEEEIQKGIELAKKLRDAGALYVSFFFATPYPGSKLYEMAINGGFLDEDFNPDNMNWKTPIMKNTIVSRERLIEIQTKANKECNSEDFIHEVEGKTIKELMK